MDQLIALPIKGESFLLSRSGRHVLVDGGYNSAELAEALRRYAPGLSAMHVVVCTHGDADHARGLSRLIDTWGHAVGEFWLPGNWVEVLPKSIESARQFVDGLLMNSTLSR